VSFEKGRLFLLPASAADFFDQTVVEQLLSGLDGHFAVPLLSNKEQSIP
jgi:hypothetical protein